MAVRPVIALLAVLAVLAGVVVTQRHDDSAVVATIPVGLNPIGVVADTQTGLAFVVDNGDDSVDVVDTRRAVLRRTVKIGSGPSTVLLDAPGRRLVVMNTGWRALEQGGQILAYSWDGSGSSSVSILDAASGRLLRTTPADVAVHGAVVDPESWRGFISAYDLHDEGIGLLRAITHRPIPLSEVPGRPIAVASDMRAHRAIIVSEVDEPGAAVSVYDTASGRFIQNYDIGAVFGRRSLAVDERTGRAFIATMSLAANAGLSGAVIVLDTRTGALLHTVALPYAPAAVAVDAQDARVFVSSLGLTNPAAPQRARTGTVSALDARTGALLHSSTVGAAPGPLAVDTRHHHVLALTAGPLDASGNASGPGTIVVLDGRSGAVLRTIAAGLSPGDVALDEQANRALVLNFGGAVRSPNPWAWLPQGLRRLASFLPGAAGAHTVRGSVMVLDTARL